MFKVLNLQNANKINKQYLSNMSTSVFNFNWDYVPTYGSSKSSEMGSLRCSDEGRPLVSVKRYGDINWEPFSSLSGSNWMKHRYDIADSLNKLFMDADAILKNHSVKIIKNEAIVMLTELYERLPPEEKKEFIIKHNKTFLGAIKCPNCLETCKSGSKVKCINHECFGMCKKCLDKIGDKCPVCDAVQETTCPICQETKTCEQLCKSDTCGHFVCWECCGRAFKAGHPIHNCPLCRADFIKRDDDDDDDGYDSMPSLHHDFSDSDSDDDDVDEQNQSTLYDGGYPQNSSTVPYVNFGDVEMMPTVSPEDVVAAQIQIQLWAEQISSPTTEAANPLDSHIDGSMEV